MIDEGDELERTITQDLGTIGGTIFKASNILRDAGIDNFQAEARHLMVYLLDDSLAGIYSRLNEKLDDVTRKRYMNLIKKRTTHYPFQYILGYTYFMDYQFICREKVLIPRYDTENLLLHALELSPSNEIKALDMCTGSGCIGISYKLERMKEGYDDEVTLVDISDDALNLAKDNAEKLGANVRFVKSDMFSELIDEQGNPKEKYSLIMCNPPYIRSADINYLMKDVRDYEPRLALDGSRDGLAFYRIVVSQAKDFLKEGGSLVLEIGYEQYMDVADMLTKNGYRGIHRMKDMSGLDRVVSAYI